MQDAVPVGKGGMIALLGADIEISEKIAKAASEYGICQVANDNGAGQIVLSGTLDAIQEVSRISKEFGIKRAIKLPVSAPFHSDLIQPAAEIMSKALVETEVNSPSIPVISNVAARAF